MTERRGRKKARSDSLRAKVAVPRADTRERRATGDPAPAAGVGPVLRALLEHALRMGADGLELEYERGDDVVFAVAGSTAVGIATLRSGSAEGMSVREDLAAVTGRATRVCVCDVDLELRTSRWDSFGECCFRVRIRRLPRGDRSRRRR